MWWQVLFWALLVPTLIVLGIVYGTSKKLYRLFYILATFTYVILIAYVIDVFSLGRNPVLGLLTFSAVLMLLLGYRLTRKVKKRQKPSRRYLFLLGFFVILMLAIILLGAVRTSTSREVSVVQFLARDALWTNESTYPQNGVPVANITYTNTFFLPYVVPDRYFTACLNDPVTGGLGMEELQVFVDGQYSYPNNPFGEIMPGRSVTRHLSVVQSFRPVMAKGAVQPSYDSLVLVASDRQVSCSSVTDMRVRNELSLDVAIPLTS